MFDLDLNQNIYTIYGLLEMSYFGKIEKCLLALKMFLSLM